MGIPFWSVTIRKIQIVEIDSVYLGNVDRYGRRPVILVGVMGLAMATLLFGLSRNFVVVMLTRALGNSESFSFQVVFILPCLAAGLASGNVTVIPSMLIEITDKTNQAQAFPFFGVWWPVGAIIGFVVPCHRSMKHQLIKTVGSSSGLFLEDFFRTRLRDTQGILTVKFSGNGRTSFLPWSSPVLPYFLSW